MKSPAERLAALPKQKRDEFIASLSESEIENMFYDWRGFLARPNQITPDGDWDIWLVLAGRGFGKTRTGAEWIREQVESGSRRIALIAETQKDLEEVMIEGDSGILSVYQDRDKPIYRKKPVRLDFKNGAVALGYNATQPDQLRGPQFDCAWCDELAKWRYARKTWDQLQFGMRLGDKPRQIVTTTPRPIELIKSMVAGNEGLVHVTRGRTMDNASNLAKTFLAKITDRYAGTRLGRQELDAEILGDIPGALWRLGDLDTYRVNEQPQDLKRIIVSVDPAVTNTEKSDYHGIIVSGIGSDGTGYVLEDASLVGSPVDWARKAVQLYNKYNADAIVAEVNQGGDMVTHTIRSVSMNANIKEVRASKGKHIRAEPVAALYEQGRVKHVGAFPELETQMSLMTNAGYEGDDSPDRVDALVWGLSYLFPSLIAPITQPTAKPKPINNRW
jgi:phage terminase large subunit-like protein